MAEQEVIKHTRKIYKSWFNREHSIWHKLSDLLVEIIIIVFAVSISIWFHNRSEHAHEQEEVKAFMMGLKSDLIQDIKEMQTDMESYREQGRIYEYLSSLKRNETPNKDTLKKYKVYIFNTTELSPNNGRFEGFKSSGKIGSIENKELQNDIMDLYQENIPALLASSQGYINIKTNLLYYVFNNQKRITDSTTNYIEVLKNDLVYSYSTILMRPSEVLERYNSCIQLMQKIIKEIDKEYT
jgi:protein associated with RNAse G/E